MWDLPGPGLEPVSPALAGRFLTTAPPGKSPEFYFCRRYFHQWKAAGFLKSGKSSFISKSIQKRSSVLAVELLRKKKKLNITKQRYVIFSLCLDLLDLFFQFMIFLMISWDRWVPLLLELALLFEILCRKKGWKSLIRLSSYLIFMLKVQESPGLHTFQPSCSLLVSKQQNFEKIA